jgi:hypothetical protein
VGIFGERKKYADRGFGEYYELNTRGMIATTLTVLAIGAGLFAEKGLDILGDRGHKIQADIAEAKAQEQYKNAFKKASPAGKFVLQYLTTTEVRTPKYEGNWGLLSFIGNKSEEDYLVSINDGCLSSTAYDIAGGSIRGSFSGLFSSGSVEGDMPTAAAFAYVDSKHPDRLTVKSGHDNSVDLRFLGASDDSTALYPADGQTRDVLYATNKCEDGLIGIRGAYYGETSSDYLR